MLNKMKIINVFCIIFLIVVSTELIGAEHLAILKPDETEESYLKGSREEKKSAMQRRSCSPIWEGVHYMP